MQRLLISNGVPGGQEGVPGTPCTASEEAAGGGSLNDRLAEAGLLAAPRAPQPTAEEALLPGSFSLVPC